MTINSQCTQYTQFFTLFYVDCNPDATDCKRRGQKCDPYTHICRNICNSHGDCKGKDEKCDSITHICTACPVLVCHSDAHPVQESCSNCKCLRSDCDDERDIYNTKSWTAKGGCPTCECDVGYAGDGNHCALDSDMDGRPDVDLDCKGQNIPECKKDNCILVPNPDQKDTNRDGTGDVCDEDQYKSCSTYPDTDGDGVGDACDNCKDDPNTDQSNIDGDESGDYCDKDMDGDGVNDDQDNCSKVPNNKQVDSDSDGIGDVCDNCPSVYNLNQTDIYFGGIGDACKTDVDKDKDGIPDQLDNCPSVSNPEQLNKDKDFFTNVNFYFRKEHFTNKF